MRTTGKLAAAACLAAVWVAIPELSVGAATGSGDGTPVIGERKTQGGALAPADTQGKISKNSKNPPKTEEMMVAEVYADISTKLEKTSKDLGIIRDVLVYQEEQIAKITNKDIDEAWRYLETVTKYYRLCGGKPPYAAYGPAGPISAEQVRQFREGVRGDPNQPAHADCDEFIRKYQGVSSEPGIRQILQNEIIEYGRELKAFKKNRELYKRTEARLSSQIVQMQSDLKILYPKAEEYKNSIKGGKTAQNNGIIWKSLQDKTNKLCDDAQELYNNAKSWYKQAKTYVNGEWLANYHKKYNDSVK